MRKGADTVQRVTNPQFIRQGRCEEMNVLNGSHAIVEGKAASVPRNVWPCVPKAGQRQELGCIGEEEFNRE